MTDRQRKQIIKFLKGAFRSEDAHSYADEDYSWGPALGAAANAAKEHNKELRELIRALGGSTEPKKKFSKNKYTMPFGKHKGADITVLPHGYLAWVVNVVKTGPLKRALEKELDKRGPYRAPRRSRYSYDMHDYYDDDMAWECPLNG